MKFNEALEKYMTEGKKVTIDIDLDWGDPDEVADSAKKYKIKIKETSYTTADVTGDPKNIKKYLLGDDYGMDPEDLDGLYPELG